MINAPSSYKGVPLVHAWTYHDCNGKTLGVVARYQVNDGKKDIVPFFNPNGSPGIPDSISNKRPLFGLDILAAHPKEKTVFIVEGEKSAAALQQLDFCAVTSIGGCQSALKADWTVLSGFSSVYMLPDNDEPGEHYAQDVYKALSALESPPQVKILRLPGLPAGGDVVDWVQGFIKDWDGYAPLPADTHESMRAELRADAKDACLPPDDWDLVGSDGSDTEVLKWEEPMPINSELKPVKSFDFGLLPNAFRAMVADSKHRMQCPPDFIAGSVMVALSAVVGKKGCVNPKERDDWTVCPNLWGLNIGRPSAMKSPAASEALKPLRKLEIQAKEDYDNAIEISKAESLMNKIGRELAEKSARKLMDAKKFDEAKALLLENPSESAEPTIARYIVADATIEKLGELLNENPNGLLLYRDEISGFLKTIDKEDRANDRSFYVEAFDGLGTYIFDRINRGTIHIESLCVAMLGNIQPDVLRPFLNQAANGTSKNDGMIQRFQLAVWPDVGGWEFVDQWPDTLAKDAAFEVFDRLSKWNGFGDNKARFSQDAQQLFNGWYNNLQMETRNSGLSPTLESHYGKYASLIPSMAVLIHLADDPYHSLIVGKESLTKAIAWGDYLRSHAERIYASALDPVDANSKAILSKIESYKLADGFGTGDVKRGGWSGLDNLDAIKAALSRLVEYGYLREKRDPAKATGRPSLRYLINPKFLAKTPR